MEPTRTIVILTLMVLTIQTKILTGSRVALAAAGLGVTYACLSEALLLPREVVFRAIRGRRFYIETVAVWRKDSSGISQRFPAVGADLAVMERDTKKMRGPGPYVFAQVKNAVGLPEIIDHLIHNYQHSHGLPHAH